VPKSQYEGSELSFENKLFKYLGTTAKNKRDIHYETGLNLGNTIIQINIFPCSTTTYPKKKFYTVVFT
jgi:hypothetical protein